MPVHLYGQPADMRAHRRRRARHNLAIVEDCCQAHLATCEGRPVGSVRRRRRLQLLPDQEPRRARRRRRAHDGRRGASPARAKRLRNGGQTDRYHHDEFGVNSRLDEMQAAILRARLPFLARWTERRRALGRRYRAAARGRRCGRGAAGARCRPRLSPLSRAQRACATRCRRTCEAPGIETLIHYPVPIPRQPALAAEQPADCPGRRLACAAKSSRCRSTRALADAAVDAVASAVASGPRARPRHEPEPRSDAAAPCWSVRAHRGGAVRLFEVGLRTWGSSEAAPAFQGLFDDGPGDRLPAASRTPAREFATSEFDAEIAINGAGVRDDDEIGPKPPRRAADRAARRLAGAVGAGAVPRKRSANCSSSA